ncbi:MAG: hypothetical protein F2534_04570 [Actinobacteria bacterium]|uniref:Unannotated protein n=1 Tax=freshwater metagenome TaxID=449393 RepID=A0A6J6GZ09_9ZZZZ|nr:hypothetical protein [Actinomycetota bacterium]
MAGNPLNDPNWAPELANLVDRYVGLVRDNVTGKAVTAVRGIVFGVVVALTSIAALILGLILGTRLLQRLVNIGGFIDRDSSVWVSYMVIGGILVLAGMFCMRKRHTPTTEASR